MSTKALPAISPECLSVVNDQVTTTSLDVARIFGKRHDNVIQAIEAIEIPEEFRKGERNNHQTSDHETGI